MRKEDVTLQLDNFLYLIRKGRLTINGVEWERESSPEMYEIVYAYVDLELAYREDD